MVPISEQAAEAAIAYLYNKVEGRKIGDSGLEGQPGDLKRYGQICAFLSNEDLLRSALITLAGTMQTLFNAKGDEYEVTAESGVWRRRLAVSDNDMVQRKQAFGAKFKSAEPDKALLDDKLLVRRFQFRPILKALEEEFCGFTDKGRVMFGDPGAPEFGKVLRTCEVWKDSIAFEHGEYTHRLQWLLVQQQFKFYKGTMRRLYAGCSNPIKKARAEELRALEDPKLTAAGSLWEFLFDCFPANAESPSFWPRDPQPDPAPDNPISRYRYSGRSDSFRAPRNFTAWLTQHPETGLIFAYLSSSQMKLSTVSQGAAGLAFKGLGPYRRERLADKLGDVGQVALTKNGKKFVYNQFVAPFDGRPEFL